MNFQLSHKSIVFNIFAPLFHKRVRHHSALIMKQLLLFFLVTINFQLVSQTNGGINSPFSRFGIGDIATESPMYIRQMGGIGTSFIDAAQLNFDNPSTLGYLNQTAFNLGLDFQRANISDGDNQSTQFSGNLGSLALGFTLRNPTNALFTREDHKFNLGMGFALLPNSTVSYDISSLDITESGEVFNRNFSGSGGSYKFIWSNAIKAGNFSFGVSTGWLFGQIEYARIIDFENLAAFDNSFTTEYNMRGFYSKLGASYLHILNKEEVSERPGSVAPKSVAFGLTYKPGIGISTNAEVANVNAVPFATFGVFVDTLFQSVDLDGSGRLPAELAFGITYNHGLKFALGFDYRTTYWSNYRNDANPEELINTTRIGFGGYIRPNYASTGILPRSLYRLGFYYEQNPQIIEGNQIESYGVTVGIGLPLAWQRKFSHVNLGFDIGKRSVTNILSENFVRLTFGFTFNESDWFRRYYLD